MNAVSIRLVFKVHFSEWDPSEFSRYARRLEGLDAQGYYTVVEYATLYEDGEVFFGEGDPLPLLDILQATSFYSLDKVPAPA